MNAFARTIARLKGRSPVALCRHGGGILSIIMYALTGSPGLNAADVSTAPASNASADTTHPSEGVILLHGLARSCSSMERMKEALEEAGFVVVNQGYASRKAEIAELSEEAIGTALTDPALDGATRLHFVTHSLGGILVRDYFSRHENPRLGRVVMLGPPNAGSEVVDRLRDWRVYQWINGPAGQQLGTDEDSVPNQLGSVDFELGVIAGSRSINWINSFMIEGKDDGKVSLENSKVEGMTDHLVMPVTHPFIMKNKKVIAQVLEFLQHGKFDHD